MGINFDGTTTNTTTVSNLTDDGFDAVMAIRCGDNGFVFDGKYSNADVAAIAESFTKTTGKRPASYWLASLRG